MMHTFTGMEASKNYCQPRRAVNNGVSSIVRYFLGTFRLNFWNIGLFAYFLALEKVGRQSGEIMKSELIY